ncbi:MAG: hypothetical protein HYS13_12035 [Planctomycetia bacterium]|nr:hypothetical protein [Planctomycetia bacterium]
MTKLVLDANTLAKLHNLAAPFEVCDESGRTLGYFHPVGAPGAASSGVKSPISDEEIGRRRQQRTGRPLAEILENLAKL